MRHLAVTITTAIALALALPRAADAQHDVTRRTYTFLGDRLVVAVLAEAPGELKVVRGQYGRIEVAARSRDGFAGFGLGGGITRELRLTAVGSDAVQYLVVVPERVAVSVSLPGGGTADVPGSDIATYRWDGGIEVSEHPADPDAYVQGAMLPSTAGGLYIVHSGRRTPSLVDIPDLASIRSVSVRVQGDEFQVAATRPLALTPGDAGHMVIRVDGEPLDLVFYVPRASPTFHLRSGSTRIAEVRGGRPRSFCGSTVLQRPTPNQDWLTVFPASGRLSCR